MEEMADIQTRELDIYKAIMGTGIITVVFAFWITCISLLSSGTSFWAVKLYTSVIVLNFSPFLVVKYK